MPDQLTHQLKKILQHYFGYEDFRPGQLEIIKPLVQGRDILAILPTGGGKSLCFQIPGLYLGGTTLVISPLISLMQDQVQNLNKHGIKATFLNSTLSLENNLRRQKNLAAGAYQFVYVAPEKLQNRAFLQACFQAKIALVAIDEAHCVSVWGHDFRPSYLQIGQFIKKLPQRPAVAAFTATANLRAQHDITQFCGLQKQIHIQKSFARKNLRIMVHQCFNEHDKLLRILYLLEKHRHQTGIIYVLTRRDAHVYARLLNRLRPNQEEIAIYHGGLDKEIRQQIQKGFIDESIKIIIATNAFGLGIDQPRVRFVIHAQISSNLENYFQEIGRAGRDGNLSDCYTLFTKKDLEISAQFITRNSSASKTQLKILRFKLKQIIKYLQTRQCRQKFILNYFDEKTPLNFACQLCDHCRRTKLTYDSKIHHKFTHWQSWRQNYAQTKNLIPNSVISNLSLAYLSIVDWRHLKDLTLIPGIGFGAKKILTCFFTANQD